MKNPHQAFTFNQDLDEAEEAATSTDFFIPSLALTVVAFIVVALVRFAKRAREGAELTKRRKKDRSRITITVILFILIFATIWLFYLRGGLGDAKAAWEFCGPLMGAVVGWWFPSK